MQEQPIAGRYRRTRLLGRGAMGQVWLADDLVLHRAVAVKSVTSAEGADAADGPDLDRMVREARTAARLNHPNAVAVYDLVVDGGQPHLVMEYVPGRSLADEIAASPGGLAPERVRALGVALAEALAEAHRLGIVHRDVKPANVLITGTGAPKLADFGIARTDAIPGTTATGMMRGTPSYLAPEVIHGAPADAATDVWSLGMTLYAALNGKPAFHADNVFAVLNQVATEAVPPPAHGGPLAATVMTLLERDPARRPDAARAGRLLSAPAQDHVTTIDRPPEDRTGRPSPWDRAPDAAPRVPPDHAPRRRLFLAAAIVAVVGVGIGAGAAVWSGQGDDGGSRRAGSPPTSRVSSPPSSATGAASSGSTPSVAATSSYTGPGGISVNAPTGWTPDTSAGIANVLDYLAPGAADRSSGAYFRIGIANAQPADSIQNEARGTQRYLESAANGTRARLEKTSFVQFLGVPAVDQEYVGTNSDGVARHFKLRLWIQDGHTLEIELNSPDAQWSAVAPVFDQLVANCQVN